MVYKVMLSLPDGGAYDLCKECSKRTTSLMCIMLILLEKWIYLDTRFVITPNLDLAVLSFL